MGTVKWNGSMEIGTREDGNWVSGQEKLQPNRYDINEKKICSSIVYIDTYKDGQIYNLEPVENAVISPQLTYSGQVSNGEPHGYGKGVYAKTKGDDRMYTGYWKLGKENGYGEAIYNDGRVYKGNWKDGHSNLLGFLTTSEGIQIQGMANRAKLLDQMQQNNSQACLLMEGLHLAMLPYQMVIPILASFLIANHLVLVPTQAQMEILTMVPF